MYAAGAGLSWLPTQCYQVFARSCTRLVKAFIRQGHARYCHEGGLSTLLLPPPWQGRDQLAQHHLLHRQPTNEARLPSSCNPSPCFSASLTAHLFFLSTVTRCLTALRAHLIHAASHYIKILRTHLNSSASRNRSPCSASQASQHGILQLSNKPLQPKTKITANLPFPHLTTSTKDFSSSPSP